MSAPRLQHDLGKYLARTARNVDPEAPLDAELLAMLCDDLYATYDGMRASRVFARFESELGDDDATRVLLRELLTELDAIEPRVRRGEDRAVRRAIAIACRVAEALRA